MRAHHATGPAPEASGYNPRMPPVIALLTDFGLRDHYVGAMKGAILTSCPEATLVDVAPRRARPTTWPRGRSRSTRPTGTSRPGTVFVAVVDPGVGSRAPADRGRRRPLALRRPRQRPLHVRARGPPRRPRPPAREPAALREPLSPVFHGRDLFGPAAAASRRRPPARGGRPASSRTRCASRSRRRRGRTTGWEGAVLHVDRFGNLTTNLLEADLEALAGRRPRRARGGARGAGPAPRALVLGRRGRARRARSSGRAGGWRSPSTRPGRRAARRGAGAPACAVRRRA